MAILWERIVRKSGFTSVFAYLHQNYVMEGKSTTAIAEECDCSHVSVLTKLKKCGIETRTRSKHFPTEQDLRSIPPKDLRLAYVQRAVQVKRLVKYFNKIISVGIKTSPGFATDRDVLDAMKFISGVKKSLVSAHSRNNDIVETT